MKGVVSDSTTLIVLSQCGRWELLTHLFESVLIPPSVHAEIHRKGTIALPSCISVVDVNMDGELETLKMLLDDRESEAIKLAKERGLLLIIDEKKGRSIARNMGVSIIGLVGIVYLNITKGFLSPTEARLFLDEVSSNGFRISNKLIEEMFAHL